ncbi:protein enabled homolog [Macrosteles quadrilineatus]|uniref:protein enabled homolog n=1 Tax=Macrosteles quadrilineatus TaxID=74068 RepID=UPI0023E09C3A|nr:protein enabled homolog [Macrosteles quadrilineatus]
MSRFAVLFKFDNEEEAIAALRDLRAHHTVKESRSYEITEVVSNYTPAGLMAAVMRCETTQRYEVQLGRKRKPTAVVSGIPAVRRRFTPPPAPLPLAANTSSPLPFAATTPSPLPLESVPPLSPMLLYPPAPLSPQPSTSWHTPPPPPPLPLTPQPSRQTPPPHKPSPEIINISSDKDSLDGLLA